MRVLTFSTSSLEGQNSLIIARSDYFSGETAYKLTQCVLFSFFN